MKRIILTLLLVVLISSMVSAEMIINQQPSGTYNLGNYIESTITITTTTGIYDFLETSIICNGQAKELPDKIITLAPNEEERIDISLLLIDTFIGELSGDCQMKLKLGEEYVLTEEFSISNLIIIELTTENIEFAPDQEIVIEGRATKGNNQPVDGFIDLTIIYNGSNTEH